MRFRRFATWLSQPRSGAEPGRASSVLVLLLAIVIALVASLAVASFHQQADARRRNQLMLADIEQLARQMRLAEEATGHRNQDPAAAERSLHLALDRLDKADPQGDAAINVREAASTYLAAAAEHIRLQPIGQQEAVKAADATADTSYRLLIEAIYQASGFYSGQATRWLLRANVGSTAAIAVLALFIGILFVFSERSRRAHAMRLVEERASKEARFRSLVQNSSDVTAVVAANGKIRYLSPAIQRVLGYDPELRTEQTCFENVHPDDLPGAQEKFSRLLSDPDSSLTLELRMQHADGSWRWVEISSSNLLSDSNVGGLVFNLRDVSERKELEHQLRHQAFHDPLTGLANRALFNSLLTRSLSGGERRGRQTAAAFYIDLDNFKHINDALGHEAGDQLLLQVAERMRSCVREADTPARLGGDEFAILTEGLSRKDTGELATRLLEDLASPFQLAGQSITVGASIGIATALAGESTEDLLRNADVAMYVAKTSGKGRFAIFEKGMFQRVKDHLEMELDMRYALEHEQFILHYQPILALDSGRLVGVEALVRWPDPVHHRILTPGEFLPLAEQTGLILPLGQWILERACTQVRAWQTQFPATAPITLSVNFSERQLLDPHILESVTQALTVSGLLGRYLIIEVGEELLLKHLERAYEKLETLKKLGVRLAIDNFGGGFSSLRKLRQLPIDVVKIHKSFVESVTLDSGDRELTHSLIDLAKRLKLQTIAEGIELDHQATTLDQMGCELGQGYHLSRPLSAQALEDLLGELGCGDWRGDEAAVVKVTKLTAPKELRL
jgi:diguanylate cyclase (GGDEF)-like protein/PAS domain S-box-containing protein